VLWSHRAGLRGPYHVRLQLYYICQVLSYISDSLITNSTLGSSDSIRNNINNKGTFFQLLVYSREQKLGEAARYGHMRIRS
jgi:hypothetical protein